MATVQHIYHGVGDPNNNPALALTGNAVGVHIYMDTTAQEVWMSVFNFVSDVKTHVKWIEVGLLKPIE